MTRKPAEVIVSRMKTCDGTISVFFFMRHSPRTCKREGCLNELCPTNQTGYCISHTKKYGKLGKPKVHIEQVKTQLLPMNQ